jgi:hypothetical protein
MSASIDYQAIATITIFTTICVEVAKELIEYAKKFYKKIRKKG